MPSPAPTRILIPIDSEDLEAWELAAFRADDIATKSASVREVILLTHAMGNLQHTSLAGHLGANVTKALLAKSPVTLPSSRKPLRHATLKTLGGFARGAVIIVYYADEKLLELVDGLDGVAAVIVVSDFPDDAAAWVARWNPEIPGQVSKPAASLIADAVVERALLGLSKMINLSHAILHPRDKGYADEWLRILRAKGHKFEPDAMKSWAIQNGWKPGAAEELATLAKRVGGLKAKPSLAKYHEPDARYARWAQSSGER